MATERELIRLKYLDRYKEDKLHYLQYEDTTGEGDIYHFTDHYVEWLENYIFDVRDFGKELLGMYNSEKDRAKKLSSELDKAKLQLHYVTLEMKMLNSLLKHGKIYVNYWSRDCDGVECTRALAYDSIEELQKDEESHGDSADGPFSFDVVDKEDWWSESQTGTCGQGWGIN